MGESLNALRTEIRACTLCRENLPLGPRPVVQLDSAARVLVAGQAPGIRVHESGIPFDDPSGERLRQWMGIDAATFYDASRVAILPMGFCYPGTGSSGDLPPRPECASTWRTPVLSELKNLTLTLVIGMYAQKWHLPHAHKTVTATVKAWQSYPSDIVPLPHPSPRNNIWLKKNPWFQTDLLPSLQARVQIALG